MQHLDFDQQFDELNAFTDALMRQYVNLKFFEVSIDYVHYKERREAMKKLVGQLNELESIEFNDCKILDTNTLLEILDCCNRETLEEIIILHSGTATKVKRNLPFPIFHNVTRLTLKLNDEDMVKILPVLAPNVSDLRVYRAFVNSEKDEDFTEFISQYAESLRSLQIEISTQFGRISCPFFQNIRFNKLEKLSLKSASYVDDGRFIQVSTGNCLKELTLISEVSEHFVNDSWPVFAGVKKLHLYQIFLVSPCKSKENLYFYFLFYF